MESWTTITVPFTLKHAMGARVRPSPCSFGTHELYYIPHHKTAALSLKFCGAADRPTRGTAVPLIACPGPDSGRFLTEPLALWPRKRAPFAERSGTSERRAGRAPSGGAQLPLEPAEARRAVPQPVTEAQCTRDRRPGPVHGLRRPFLLTPRVAHRDNSTGGAASHRLIFASTAGLISRI